jgi:hypothetical protein
MFRLDVKIIVSGTEYVIPDHDTLKRFYAVLMRWWENYGNVLSEGEARALRMQLDEAVKGEK